MALPQDGQDANSLTKVTQIPAGKELMFIDPTTNEGGIITLEDLTKQILNGLASQAFALDAGQMTLLAALNKLNSDMGVKIAQYYTKDGTLTIKTNWKGAEYDRATIAVISSNGGAIVAELSKSTIISTNSTDSTVKINFSDKELTFSNLPWYSSPFFMFDSKKIDLL